MPIPFRPKHGPSSKNLDLVNGDFSIPKPGRGLPNGPGIVPILEVKLNGA